MKSKSVTEEIESVFDFKRHLERHLEGIWKDRYGELSVLIGNNLLSKFLADLRKQSVSYAAVVSPLVEKGLPLPSESRLGLTPNSEDAAQITKGLKSLRTGDLFELELSKEMESEIVQVDERLNRESETLDNKVKKGGEKR